MKSVPAAQTVPRTPQDWGVKYLEHGGIVWHSNCHDFACHENGQIICSAIARRREDHDRIAVVALILNCPLSQAQAPGQLPEFEVASIKRNKTNERIYYGLRNASLTVRNMTVMGLIQTAYGKRDFQIICGPAWIASEGFDIDAKAQRPQTDPADPLTQAEVLNLAVIEVVEKQLGLKMGIKKGPGGSSGHRSH
jgi:hypothetical protein